MRKIAVLLVAALLLSSMIGCSKSTEQTPSVVNAPSAVNVPGVTDTTITVGVIHDATGPNASSQAPYIAGIKNYIKMINDNGGVNGRKIEVKVEDDQSKVDKALAGFTKLVQDGVFALAGQAGGSQSAALDVEIKDEKIPVWGPFQTTTQQSQNPYFFNFNLGYDAMAKLWLARVADLQKGKPEKAKVAFFGIDIVSGHELGDYLKNFAPTYNVEIVQQEFFPATTTELSAQITKLKQSGANYVCLLSSTNIFIAYLRDAARLGASNITALGSTGALSPAIFETAGKEATANFSGLQSFSPYNDGAGQQELKAWAEKNNVSADIYAQLTYTQAWTSTKLLVETLKKAGKNLTRENFIKAAENIQNFDTGGLMASSVSFDAKNHDAASSAKFYTYDLTSKKIVPISDTYKIK